MSKTLLVTGGTGSFGNAVVKKFLNSKTYSEVRIFSRDESKQDRMAQEYNNSKLSFYLGDIRDEARIKNVSKGVDVIFHAAALKIVPSCENATWETIKTNIIGSKNVMLERSPIQKAVKAKKLAAYKHTNFWFCMDTLRDKKVLDSLIKNKKAPWLE